MCANAAVGDRIYKAKYMDDDAAAPKSGKDVDASLSSLNINSPAKEKDGREREKDAKAPPGRARARSIWGRSKK